MLLYLSFLIQSDYLPLGISDPLYYSVHSNYARLSEDGKSTVLHVFKYHHPDDHIDGKKV